MGPLGWQETLVIFVLVLLLFGPKKLPELGKSIGRAMAEFKKASEDFQDSVRAEMREVEREASVKEDIKSIEQSILDGTKAAEEPAAARKGYAAASVKEEHAATSAYGEEQKEKQS